MEKYILEKAMKEGLNFKVIFQAKKETPFSLVEPAVIWVADTKLFHFCFQISGSSKTEFCYPNNVAGCRRPVKTLKTEINGEKIFINGAETSSADLKVMLNTKPENVYGYVVSITCKGKTTFGQFYHFIEFCNQSKYGGPELNINKINP